MSSAWPSTIGIAEIDLRLSLARASFESSFTRQRTVVDLNAGKANRWEGTITTAILTAALMREFYGWICGVAASDGQFTVGDPDYSGPQSGADSGTVNGGGQTGTTLAVSGVSGSYGRGEYLQFGNELKIITADATVSGGNVTLSIAPAIRTSPSGGAGVTFDTPVLLAYLTTDPQKVTDSLKFGRGIISFEEVV